MGGVKVSRYKQRFVIAYAGDFKKMLLFIKFIQIILIGGVKVPFLLKLVIGILIGGLLSYKQIEKLYSDYKNNK